VAVSYTASLVDSASRRAGVTQVPIATRRFADTLVAAPAGRIDHLSAPQFESDLAPLVAQVHDGSGALVLDFSAVDYISSGGLRVLMIVATTMRSQQGRLLVAALQGIVAEIFAISRFDRVLTVSPSVEEALAQCSPAALAAYRQSAGAA
jgi:anti-anti-sigma factor